MNDFKLDGPSENAFSRLQDTRLNPMEEALFQTWTKANKIAKPDAPGDSVDYRGLYKQTGGAILPHGELKKIADRYNDETTLQRVLQQRMIERISNVTGSKEDMIKDQFKAERQDVTHKQKMEIENLKLQQKPLEVELKDKDIQGKEMDIEKGKVGNKGKQIDLVKNFMQPAGGSGGVAKKASK